MSSLGSRSEGAHGGTSGVAGSFLLYFSHPTTKMEERGLRLMMLLAR